MCLFSEMRVSPKLYQVSFQYIFLYHLFLTFDIHFFPFLNNKPKKRCCRFYAVKWYDLSAVFLHCNPKEFILGGKY